MSFNSKPFVVCNFCKDSDRQVIQIRNYTRIRLYKTTVYETKSLIRQVGNDIFGASDGKYDVICKTGALIRQMFSGTNLCLINNL